MSIEADLVALIKPLCARVASDFAPYGTQRPFVVYQVIGGRNLRWLDGSAPDKRHHYVQLSVWAETRPDASALAADIEQALCAAATVTASPQAEPTHLAEEDLGLYGCQQDFSIYCDR